MALVLRYGSNMEDSDFPRVLLVDDEETILFAMSRYFEAKGLCVDVANTVELAGELITCRRYAAAIVDLRLTTVDDSEGLQVVRLMREHQPECRIVVLTAYGTTEVRREALRCGVDAFLSKPKRLPDLVGVVSELIANQRTNALH